MIYHIDIGCIRPRCAESSSGWVTSISEVEDIKTSTERMSEQTPDSDVKDRLLSYLQVGKGKEKNKVRRKVYCALGLIIILLTIGAVVAKLLHRDSSSSIVRQGCSDSSTGYEIFTESFRDSSKKAKNGNRKTGDGIGDIKGNFSY